MVAAHPPELRACCARVPVAPGITALGFLARMRKGALCPVVWPRSWAPARQERQCMNVKRRDPHAEHLFLDLALTVKP